MWRKLVNFIVKNGALTGLAFLHYNVPSAWTWTLPYLVARNTALCTGIEYFTRSRPYISENYVEPRERYRGEFMFYLLQGSLLEYATAATIGYAMVPASTVISRDLLLFIPLSFGVEVLFDFMHYWAHRIMHENRYLYRLHKTHHSHHHVRPVVAFYQNIVDLVLSNSIPFALSIYAFHYIAPISKLQLCLLYTYKIFIEIAGHNNKTSYPTCSFPQFIWLPKLFGIELLTEDHNVHHTRVQCNYAKRFTLWDKVFGTYRFS